MEYYYSYVGLEDRRVKVDEAEGLGYRMLHDNFDPDWVPGEEPHGIMIFTDEPEPEPPPTPEAQLPCSTHFGQFLEIDMEEFFPAKVLVYWSTGEQHVKDCLITEEIKENYIQTNQLSEGDWVLVNFIECMPNSPIVIAKVYPIGEIPH